MAETVNNANWQSIGSTIPQEYRFVTHLQDTPPSTKNFKGVTPLRRNQSIRSVNRGGSPTPGGASLKRHNAVRLTTKAKIIRFLRRFTWNKRSKGYLFGKSYLQRQPSLVITPDLSSFSYHFNNRDLAKRKPGPHYKRTSQPVAAWKNMNPMGVLMGTQTGSPPRTSPPHHGAFNSRPNSKPNSRPNSRPNSSRPNSGSEDHHRESTNSNSTEPFRDLMTKEPEDAKGVPNWVRISLPVKQTRNKKLNTSDGSRSTEDEQRVVGERQDTTKQEAKSPVPRDKSGGDDSRKAKTTSWIDAMPQTPVRGLSSREFGSNSNTKDTSTPTGDVSPSGRSKYLAYAVTATPPESPTALPSNYRPESWRKSAIITRDGNYSQYTGSSTSIDGLANTWSMYIRQAVAQRAIESKDRRSRELENEMRWSQNLNWDSEDESIRSGVGSNGFNGCRSESTSSGGSKFSTPAVHARPHKYMTPDVPEPITPAKPNERRDDSEGDVFFDSNESSGSIPKTPIQHTRPTSAAIPPISPLKSAFAVTTHEGARSPTLVRVKSPSRQSTTKLAPLNSPRAMASASALASAVSLAAAVQDARGKLETSADGTGLNESQWLKETGSPSDSARSSRPSSMASSSLFNEDDYIFPTQDQFSTGHASSILGSRTSNKETTNRESNYHHIPLPSTGSEDFDFSTRSTSRKRHFQASPTTTPPRSPALEAIRANLSSANALEQEPRHSPQKDSNNDGITLHKHRRSQDSTHSASSVEISESAPTIVRSQSQWKQRSLSHNPRSKGNSVLGQKRIKSSGSKDYLLHTRRKTMESEWDEEEESE